MNEYALLHMPDSRYCFAVGKKELVLRLRASKEDRGAKVYLVHAPKYVFHEKRERTAMTVCYSDRLYDYYEIALELADVRFAYIFEFHQNGKTYYYSEDGLTEEYRFEESFYNFFQMLLHDSGEKQMRFQRQSNIVLCHALTPFLFGYPLL